MLQQALSKIAMDSYELEIEIGLLVSFDKLLDTSTTWLTFQYNPT